jgi:LuxR family maltose regulon positive regulatory protein
MEEKSMPVTTTIPLTDREVQILLKMMEGSLNKEISSEFNISIDTVKKHLKNIYRKINARNRIEAVQYGIALRSVG